MKRRAYDERTTAHPSPLPEGRLPSGVRAKISRTNLDVPMSRLVGRHGELEALRGLLARERLVTMLGAPGVGKTRLARECALRLLDEYGAFGGVWFVDLTEATSATGVDAICSAVGRALDVSVVSNGDAVAQLGTAIAARGRILLVLDNAEQVGEPAARVLETWLRTARDAKWLVTSRARLGTPGEVLFELGPLSLPIAGVDVELSDAVRLFIERARAARLDFALTREDAPIVARLVRELDGNALAIELAAARARSLTPAQMLAQLDQRFELLTGLARRAHPRHLSLRAAIDASWNLLDAAEKEALAQCAVFAGGFDVDAAARVVCLSGEPGAPAPRVVDVLEALRDKSLLYTYAPAESRGELRFSMYLSVREYAWQKLVEMQGVAGVIQRHSRYYGSKGASWRARLDGPDGGASTSASSEREQHVSARIHLTLEMENLAAAVRRAEDDTLTTLPLADRAVAAAHAALALSALLGRAGPNTLRFSLVDEALGLATRAGVDAALRAELYEARADAHRMLGHAGEALADYTASARLADLAGDRGAHARAKNGLGILCIWQGRLDLARAHFEAAKSIFTSIGDRVYAGRALGWLANVHLYESHLEQAWSVFEEAIAVHRAVGDRRFEGMNVGNLAVIAHDAGRLDEAKALYERALAIHREVGDRRLEAEVLGLIAIVLHEEGRQDDARDLYMRALKLHGEIGNRRAEGTLLGYFAGFLTEVGETEEARLAYARSLCILRECHDKPTEGLVLGGLAGLEAAEGCIESSRAALQRASECLREPAADDTSAQREQKHAGDTRYVAAVEVYRGYLELALAREASRVGEDSRRSMYVESVRQRLAEAVGTAEAFAAPRSGLAHRSADVRLAIRGLRRALDAFEVIDKREHPRDARDTDPPPSSAALDFPPDALLVCARGRWFRPPSGEHVPIARWHALQNLVVKLAERREIAPGETLSVDELIAAGWPGERILPKAGATRVYTALSTLRRLGLRDVLVRREGGYLFNPSVPLLRVSPRR